ncbi:MAG TPA: SAF domain-containing protein [Jatrophihabitantaceae bacterium]
MATTSPTPRRVRTPNWLDLRLVAGVFLVLVSVAVGALVIANSDSTRRVWAVSHDLDAGTVLTAADLTSVKLRLTHGTELYVPADGTAGTDGTDGVVGKTVNRRMNAGELLPRAALGTSAHQQAAVTMTVPLTSDQAPKISRGQKITLWVSTKTCQARVVVAGVTVQEVDTAGGGSFGTSSAENVVVRLGPDDAVRVITALDLEGAVVRAGVVNGDPKQQAAASEDLNGCGTAS